MCECAETGSFRGYPGRCGAFVRCLTSDNVIFPYGYSCPDSQCRKSLTGICSLDCSNATCNEEVPDGKLR